MSLNKFSAKVICSVILIILIPLTGKFFVFASDKNEPTSISSHSTISNFSIVNASYSDEGLPYENYNVFMHKKLYISLLNLYAPKEDFSYSKDLLSFFPQKEGSQLYFHGYAEYAHFLTVNEINFTSSEASIILKGSMMDSYNLGDRQLDVKYTVNSNSVNESITVSHEDKSQDHALNSIIPNQTILKLPLKVDNSWKQKFSYDCAEYEAITTITSVKTINNLLQCTTTTTVSNIDGYPNNTYSEERTYEEGRGLISFSVSTPLDESFPYVVFEDNIFSYILDQYIEKK